MADPSARSSEPERRPRRYRRIPLLDDSAASARAVCVVAVVVAAFVAGTLLLLSGVASGTAGAAEPAPDTSPEVGDRGGIETDGPSHLAIYSAGPASEMQAPHSGCFAGEGRAFSIGTEGPRIAMRLHLSVLTDVGEPGSFGVELAGSTGQYDVAHLVAGVQFAGVEDAERFLQNPFDAFSLVYGYELRLPMFADAPGVDPVHTEDEPPVDGPVGVADC